MENTDFFKARRRLELPTGSFIYYSLDELEKSGLTHLEKLPFSIRILLEVALRHCNEHEVTQQDVLNLAGWTPTAPKRPGMPFIPGRVLLQDLTGVPVIADLASLRGAMSRLGGDPAKIVPLIPVDLVIDHSIQVDFFAVPDAMERNSALEFERNQERYQFLHWAQKSFNNLRVVPPANGICHQVNLEYLSKVVMTAEENGELMAFPDTLVGTDSHTTMINGLGVVGWGVGGIEAIAAMLGQPVEMLVPDVIGFKITGRLPEGVTPTDLTLTITQMLRKKGVVDKFVEFFGPGLDSLPLADRAMISNMSPENGATLTFFPVDRMTLNYLRLTGRPVEQVALVEAYCKRQHLFRSSGTPDPEFTDVLALDLETVEPSLAGPKRPQDRVALSQVKSEFHKALTTPKTERGFGLAPDNLDQTITFSMDGGSGMTFSSGEVTLSHGAVVLAAITSCTNTSNPSVLITAGLIAKKAVERGLKVKPYVKTSLAPGSRVVTAYLKEAGLLEPLAQLGFALVGYGCTTCIGNSGPLPPAVVDAINRAGLVAAAVLSGNRNFEGRITPQTLANYLASPPLVVAYALAGTMDRDLTSEPVGVDKDGQRVYLRDLWPSIEEVQETVARVVKPEMFRANYASVFSGNATWNAIASGDEQMYRWDPCSTYLQEPPFFQSMTKTAPPLKDIHRARVLAVLGDSITTDHISPAGSIPVESPAGQFLIANGVSPAEFNTYGARRGNDRIMVRGTLANIRLKNLMVPGVEGGVTRHLPEGEVLSIYAASVRYQEDGVPLVVLAGKEYGTGSSRDWAAKGVLLLGVKAVIAESFERIHRSNLVGMGVLPLQYKPGENAYSLGLTGEEVLSIEGISDHLAPNSDLTVRAESSSVVKTFHVTARINTPLEVEYYRNGGILQSVLYRLLK